MTEILTRALQLRQVVQECTGFCATSGRSIWHVLLLPCFAAVTTVLAKVAPQLAAKLLTPCDLQQADYILVKVSHALDLPSKQCQFLMHNKYIYSVLEATPAHVSDPCLEGAQTCICTVHMHCSSICL